MSKNEIRISITGARGVGKTRLVREILIPALVLAKRTALIQDGGDPHNATHIIGANGPMVNILITNDPEVALRHLAMED